MGQIGCIIRNPNLVLERNRTSYVQTDGETILEKD